jgi:hypothetical protein
MAASTRWRVAIARLSGVALVALVAACSPLPEPTDEAAAETEPAPATIESTHPAREVSLTEGYRMFAHRYTGYAGTFDRTAGEDMPASVGDPPVPPGLGPLTVISNIDHFPISCVRWHRTILGADVGDSSAARRIGARIGELAAELHASYLEHASTESDCDGIVGAAAIGESYQELREVHCELPGAGRLRCFELADVKSFPGVASGFLFHHQLVFDATTGAQLSLGDLFASVGITEDDGVELIRTIVAGLNGWEATVRQALPSADGLTFGFSPYEGGWGALGSLDLFVPWPVITGASPSP